MRCYFVPTVLAEGKDGVVSSGRQEWEPGTRSRWFVEGKLVIPCLWMACYEHIYVLNVKALYWLPHL